MNPHTTQKGYVTLLHNKTMTTSIFSIDFTTLLNVVKYIPLGDVISFMTTCKAFKDVGAFYLDQCVRLAEEGTIVFSPKVFSGVLKRIYDACNEENGYEPILRYASCTVRGLLMCFRRLHRSNTSFINDPIVIHLVKGAIRLENVVILKEYINLAWERGSYGRAVVPPAYANRRMITPSMILTLVRDIEPVLFSKIIEGSSIILLRFVAGIYSITVRTTNINRHVPCPYELKRSVAMWLKTFDRHGEDFCPEAKSILIYILGGENAYVHFTMDEITDMSKVNILDLVERYGVGGM